MCAGTHRNLWRSRASRAVGRFVGEKEGEGGEEREKGGGARGQEGERVRKKKNKK